MEIHPISKKKLAAGHPWITKDKFSERFDRSKDILFVKPYGHFIHDPKHPRVVARFWSKERCDFKKELSSRLSQALAKRKGLFEHRDNVYLSFAEADGLPGLHIQKLGNALLIQYQCFFWEKYLDEIIGFYKKEKQLKLEMFWTQKRIPGENKLPAIAYEKNQNETTIVNEAGIKLLINFVLYHDQGIYTDMSSIRKKLDSKFKNSKEVLNLYSYTGAFSLLGLKHGANVTSVDVSKKYMDWLEENISLNSFDESKHQSIVMPCQKAITKFVKNDKLFDLIISDPPSFSSDKKNKQSSLDFYKENLRNLCSCLAPGGHAVLFINTHKVPMNKFKDVVRGHLRGPLKIISEYQMSEDCTPLKKFSEGNHIKCLVVSGK